MTETWWHSFAGLIGLVVFVGCLSALAWVFTQ